MTPISKSAPLGGKRHFSSNRATAALDKAVSPTLWREPRTSPLYVGQSLASVPLPDGAVVRGFSSQLQIARENARVARSRKARLARLMFLFPFSSVVLPPSVVAQGNAGA